MRAPPVGWRGLSAEIRRRFSQHVFRKQLDAETWCMALLPKRSMCALVRTQRGQLALQCRRLFTWCDYMIRVKEDADIYHCAGMLVLINKACACGRLQTLQTIRGQLARLTDDEHQYYQYLMREVDPACNHDYLARLCVLRRAVPSHVALYQWVLNTRDHQFLQHRITNVERLYNSISDRLQRRLHLSGTRTRCSPLTALDAG